MPQTMISVTSLVGEETRRSFLTICYILLRCNRPRPSLNLWKSDTEMTISNQRLRKIRLFPQIQASKSAASQNSPELYKQLNGIVTFPVDPLDV